MAIQTLAKQSSRVVSPVSVSKATVDQIAQAREVLARHGNVPALNYEPDWVGRALAGAISTSALYRAYAGDTAKMHTEAMASGVYRWHNAKKREQLNAPETPQALGRFEGLDSLPNFLKAKPAEQDAYLKANGVIG